MFKNLISWWWWWCILFLSKNGEKAVPPSEIACPPGWILDDDAWEYDINRAVDEKGEA